MIPPYVHIQKVAKHGSDEDLLALRDEIRWLANWAEDVSSELSSIYHAATVVMTPSAYDEAIDMEVRDVQIRLKLTNEEVLTLIEILNMKGKS